MKHIFRILGTGRELWKSYVAISVLTSLLSVTTILMPLLSGWAIDEIRKGTGANVRYAVFLAIGMFILDLSQNLISNVNGYIGDNVSGRLQKILSRNYYQHLLSLPQTYFDDELSGKIINRLNRSIVQVTNFIQMMSNNFLQFIFGTILSLIMVAYYSWEVALMLLLLYPIFTWMTVKSSGKWQAWQKQRNEHLDIASGRFAEAISQIKVVKSFIQEKHELFYFNKHMVSAMKIIKPQSAYWHKQDVRRRLVLNVIFLGVYLFIFTRGAQGAFTPGQAVALILYAMNIRIPIFTISFLVESTQRAVSDSKDYFEVMNITPAIVDASNAKDLQISKGAIEFSDITFGYDQQKPVIKNVSFSIKQNTKIALVGESGEGKTTLTNLLLRFYEPQQGRITIDDQDIAKVTQKSLRQYTGVVFQEPALFSGTIRENIAYAKLNASDAEVYAAAKAANAHEFIEKLENSYDTQIGERGLKLSGGQKQRIAIARALLKDAPILVLDEATSSLDSKSEAMVQEALGRLMKGRTTIIIAHRLSTIQSVDTIITIKNGSIDEIGSPKDLAGSKGIYAQLLTLQNGGGEQNIKKLQKFDIAQ